MEHKEFTDIFVNEYVDDTETEHQNVIKAEFERRRQEALE